MGFETTLADRIGSPAAYAKTRKLLETNVCYFHNPMIRKRIARAWSTSTEAVWQVTDLNSDAGNEYDLSIGRSHAL